MDDKQKYDAYKVALLDEIAERLLSIEQQLKATEPEGIVVPYSFRVTTKFEEIEPEKPVFSVSIWNDGPDPVDVYINTTSNVSLSLNKGEQDNITYDYPKIKVLYFKCKSGFADLRVVTKR